MTVGVAAQPPSSRLARQAALTPLSLQILNSAIGSVEGRLRLYIMERQIVMHRGIGDCAFVGVTALANDVRSSEKGLQSVSISTLVLLMQSQYFQYHLLILESTDEHAPAV